MPHGQSRHLVFSSGESAQRAAHGHNEHIAPVGLLQLGECISSGIHDIRVEHACSPVEEPQVGRPYRVGRASTRYDGILQVLARSQNASSSRCGVLSRQEREGTGRCRLRENCESGSRSATSRNFRVRSAVVAFGVAGFMYFRNRTFSSRTTSGLPLRHRARQRVVTGDQSGSAEFVDADRLRSRSALSFCFARRISS